MTITAATHSFHNAQSHPESGYRGRACGQGARKEHRRRRHQPWRVVVVRPGPDVPQRAHHRAFHIFASDGGEFGSQVGNSCRAEFLGHAPLFIILGWRIQIKITRQNARDASLRTSGPAADRAAGRCACRARIDLRTQRGCHELGAKADTQNWLTHFQVACEPFRSHRREKDTLRHRKRQLVRPALRVNRRSPPGREETALCICPWFQSRTREPARAVQVSPNLQTGHAAGRERAVLDFA